jgi:Sec-independent protein translocase protein TatA
VGYFVLGPSDLYKIVKEVGKFIQNIRTLGSDFSTTIENNMESTLQLEELRKAQRELNEAFSFRRSINVDTDGEAFSTRADTYRSSGGDDSNDAADDDTNSVAEESVGTKRATTTTTNTEKEDRDVGPPRKIRRRVRKKTIEETTYPDLGMPMLSDNDQENDEAFINQEFENVVGTNDWGKASSSSTSSSSMAASTSNNYGWFGGGYTPPATVAVLDPGKNVNSIATVEQQQPSRFQQQLSGQWNNQILADTSNTTQDQHQQPAALVTVMNKIALLEQEKLAAVRRLEEEFRKRTELEQQYYQEQRTLLEEAAQQIQERAFGLDSSSLQK